MKNLMQLILCLCLITFVRTEYIARRRGLAPAKLTARPACPFPQAVPNGSFRMRRNNQIMRVSCQPGFQLQGDRIIECVNGKWVGQKPVCAKAGCTTSEVTQPEHGFIQLDSPYRMVLFCLDNYNLAGNRYAFCNGTNWDRPIGNCREPSYNVEHECDFETEDICGWVHEEGVGTQWRRVTAMNIYTSYHTGPRHDHTFASLNGGHYMLMETVDSSSRPAYLQSPIYEHDLSLKTACCFRFFYFMYGAGVGDLSVYVRPVTVSLSDMMAQSEKYEKFKKSGNQNNLWNEAHFTISELEEDFQIVFVATAGKNHLSDIAIDDVKLMTGEECTALDEDNSASNEEEATEETIFDTQSCNGRCFESTGSGFIRNGGKIFGRCNCDILCEYDDTCCPDFRIKCLNPIFMQSTEIGDETSQSFEETTKALISKITSTTPFMPVITTTTTKQPTTKLKTTPTTTKATTTKATTTTTTATTTTTTTTPKPATTTKRTTTTTTTTPKPTTTTTTTTTKRTTNSITPKFLPSKATTPRPKQNQSSVNERNNDPTKEEIAVWPKSKSSTSNQNLPSSGRVLLVTFFIIIVTILVGSFIYRYKGQMTNWLRDVKNVGLGGDGGGGRGDVETTSIRAKFRFNSQSHRHEDTDNLLSEDCENAENEANFGIDNKVAKGKATKINTEASISTNL